MARPSKYSPEVPERAVRMVREHGPEHPPQWAAITSIGYVPPEAQYSEQTAVA